jgi:hypothetical protein
LPIVQKAYFWAFKIRESMLLRSGALLGLILLGIAGYSQEKKKTSRPDIPGSILLELGLNFKNGVTPPEFQKGFWGSRTINIYYQYPIRLFKSQFSFNPGIGVSLERWKLTNNYTLPPSPAADGSYQFVLASTLLPGTIQRSQMVNNYIEAPIELRFDTNPEDIARSFNVSFGARFGVLYDSFTKIDYSDNGESKSIKDKQWHGMNPTRMAYYTRIGLGGFSLFGYYNVTPMWQTNMGPGSTDMNSVTIGISVNGF